VKDAAEREQVGARVEVSVAAALLRRHVRGRSSPGGARRLRGRVQLGDAEIEQLHPGDVARREEEVRGLEIAVDDAARVHRREGGRDAGADAHGLGDAHRPAHETRREVLTLQPLHRDVALPGVDAPVRHHAHDGRVLEPGQDVDLAFEARTRRRVGRARELDRDGLVGREIARAVDRAHRTAGRHLQQLEALVDDTRRHHQINDSQDHHGGA
jgi:hypothetical protein